MEADWSVELGADDPVLEMPWASPDGALRWQDLRRHAELIPELVECRAYPEFVEPLRKLNTPRSQFLTVKCDAYDPEPTEPAEELFGSWRLVSYTDLLFAGDTPPASENEFAPVPANFDFALHEQFARDLSARLNDLPESDSSNATVEIVIRRCIYSGSRDGFYFTLYVIGYGESPDEARQHWSHALSMCAVEVSLAS